MSLRRADTRPRSSRTRLGHCGTLLTQLSGSDPTPHTSRHPTRGKRNKTPSRSTVARSLWIHASHKQCPARPAPGGHTSICPCVGTQVSADFHRTTLERPPPSCATAVASRATCAQCVHGTEAQGYVLCLRDAGGEHAEMAKRLEREGAKAGQLSVSLMWNETDDLDLHCVEPSGEHIYYSHETSKDGAHLDVDMNAGGSLSTTPVENMYWVCHVHPTQPSCCVQPCLVCVTWARYI